MWCGRKANTFWHNRDLFQEIFVEFLCRFVADRVAFIMNDEMDVPYKFAKQIYNEYNS